MMLDDSTYNEYAIALELRKTVAEIRQMTHREWLGWQSFFKRRAAEAEVK